MADQEEKSWYDQAGDWVQQQYDDITGQQTDEGPVVVEYQEPTAEERERMADQAALSEYIGGVTAHLKGQVDYVYQECTILHGAYEISTSEEFRGLAAQCANLSSDGYTAAANLTSAGVQDWVYSVKACNEVGYWANSASEHANAAAASESPTEVHGLLGDALNDLGNASASINGA
jgi:hypothetical protein